MSVVDGSVNEYKPISQPAQQPRKVDTMTAENAQDFPYEKRENSCRLPYKRYWEMSFGLQSVDGLTPSDYAREIADEQGRGAYSLQEAGEALRSYYRASGTTSEDSLLHREADLVSVRMVELLEKGAFQLIPAILADIHRYIFKDMDEAMYQPGRYKTVALVKQEKILNGDSVLYADPMLIQQSLDYLFRQEREFTYGFKLQGDVLRNFCRFISNIWQVHPFVEGNTRTVALFSVLYLNDLGFSVDNDPFAQHAVYYRNALVRANYRNPQAKILQDLSFTEKFYDSLLNGTPCAFDDDMNCRSLFNDPSLLRNIDSSKALKV